jgi:dCTP deaminase
MVLSDRDIEASLRTGRIKLSPWPDLSSQLGSCSIDCRLGNVFRVFEHSRNAFIDPRSQLSFEDAMRKIVIADGEPFIIQPGDFVLASTIESLELPDDLVARLEGRSSLGRLGIIVHSTAAVFEPGWRGTATMELGNLGRMAVALYPGMRICSFTFEQLSSPARVPYHAKPNRKYLDQAEPEASRISDEEWKAETRGV